MKRKREVSGESEAPTEISTPRISFFTRLPTVIFTLVVSHMGPAELARFGNTSADFQVFCATKEFWTGTRRDFFCAPDFVKASLLGQAHLDFPKRQTFLRNVMPLLLEGIVFVDEITQLHIETQSRSCTLLVLILCFSKGLLMKRSGCDRCR
jgi:hypothetical protein